MPLIKPILEAALAEAFDKGMFVFAKTIAEGPAKTDISEKAREAAAATFASIAAPAIDLYIKSATVIVPIGVASSGAITAAGLVVTTTTSPGIGIIT